MKKLLLLINGLLLFTALYAQDDVYPAKENKGIFFIINATIHVGNGQVIENGTVKINDGKIMEVGQNISIPQGDQRVVDAKGKAGLSRPHTSGHRSGVKGNCKWCAGIK